LSKRERVDERRRDRWLTTEGLGEREWRLISAIAIEQALGLATLTRLAGAPSDWAAPFLESAVASGLLVPVATPGVLSLAPAPREPVFAVHPELEQRVVRRLAARGELAALAGETHALIEGRSVSDLVVALHAGDLRVFARRAAAPRLPRVVPARTEAEWLRAAVMEPFDPEWLRRAFGERAVSVAVRVVAECVDAAIACEPVVAWLASGEVAPDDDVVRVLAEHAVLRGDVARGRDLAAKLPVAERLGFTVAARFVEGDLAASAPLVAWARAGATAKALGQAKVPPPKYGAVAPVLSVMVLGDGAEGTSLVAKRWIAAGTTDGARAAAKAFRALVRDLSEPDDHHARIDVLRAGTGAWETYLSALNVSVQRHRPSSRASWAVHLVDRGLAWDAAGYAWLARQAFLLAGELDREHATRALSQRGDDPSRIELRPRELPLWDLVAPKPEWMKSLQALAEVATSSSASAELGHRVAWYVDMSDGKLARPALQSARASGGGWSHGRRLSLAELHEERDKLPPEDRRVLACTEEFGEGLRDFTPEAYEALVGHPRVFDGARGQAPVEVVRGTCRVETEEDGGHLRVIVEPEGATLGVNVVPEGESRLVVYTVTPAMARVVAIVGKGVRVPRANEQDVVRVLSQLADHVQVISEHVGAERTVPPDATPCLRFSPASGAWRVQAGVRPFGENGRFFVAGLGATSLSIARDGQRLRCVRDLAVERERVDALILACPALAHDEDEAAEQAASGEIDAWVLGEGEVLGLLCELRDSGVDHALEWPESASLRLGGAISSKSLRARLRRDKGWYLVTGGVKLDDVTELALSDIVRAPVIAGGRFLRLPSGDYVEIERRMRGLIAALKASGAPRKSGEGIEIHPAAVPALDAAASDTPLDVDAEAKAWLARVSSVSQAMFEPPEGLTAELRPYQLEGYAFLRRMSELGLGACLADDMGLGKTVQLIALLLSRKDVGPALVVAPTSVCENWMRELRRFAPGLVPVEYAGKDREALLAAAAPGQIVVCSYAILQQDDAALAAVAWGTAVLDEAQFIKNAESQRAKAAFRLQAGLRIVATGTPVENHYGDLWSLFRFTSPGLLGDWPSFRRRFVLPIERDGNTSAAAALRELVGPYVLRRKKRDVLTELPPITEITHEVRLSSSSSMRYALLRKQIHEKLFSARGRGNKIEILAEITRLRRFCCHPRLVFPDADGASDKLQAFLDLAEELRENGHRALVFSQYVDFLGMAREALDERAIAYEYLDGSTPTAARQARVDAFQTGHAPLFLISLKAGGFGLNLTAADYVIHLDPWWNPAVQAQATDRAHRIGQTRKVTVYRLVTKDTIEEKIVALHSKKQRLANELLDGAVPATLGADELLALLD
jgi:superfamily II DNA or RNA helicase